jgi:hypothetical protein
MKKLTVNDIPEGYKFAAVDSDGIAYAYDSAPVCDFEDIVWDIINKDTLMIMIGSGFDASDWKNSLIEKQTLKRLTMSDIPKGYSYAAIDSDGVAYAYKKKPIFGGGFCWFRNTEDVDPPKEIGGGFDTTNWKNSLIGGDPHVIEILNNKKKRKMEGPTLESCKFEFTQDANCLSDCGNIEKIKITHQSDLGLDRTKGGFFVLKTKGWSINSEDDIRLLLDRIRMAMKKE